MCTTSLRLFLHESNKNCDQSLINWDGIVTSPTYSFANDKFKESHEIVVIKIEELLNVIEKIKSSGLFESLIKLNLPKPCNIVYPIQKFQIFLKYNN